MVLSESGTVAIETIKPGDYVYATDPETGESGYKRVVRTFENESDELVEVTYGTETITTTPTHPFYVPQKGWTSAIELRAGDMLVTVNGEYVVIEKVQHEILEAPITVYNFEVEDFHTYYVSADANSDEFVLVHNKCGVRNTPDQDAVIQLAKANKNGISMDDAKLLVEWAKEYNLPGKPRIDLGHIGRGIISQKPHVHIGPVNHIPIR